MPVSEHGASAWPWRADFLLLLSQVSVWRASRRRTWCCCTPAASGPQWRPTAWRRATTSSDPRSTFPCSTRVSARRPGWGYLLTRWVNTHKTHQQLHQNIPEFPSKTHSRLPALLYSVASTYWQILQVLRLTNSWTIQMLNTLKWLHCK